jgi:hypothetical protein
MPVFTIKRKNVRDLSLPREKRGPYFWTPALGPREGFGGYLGKDMRIAEGSHAHLRVEFANEILRREYAYSRLAHIDGYYCDEDGGETMQPVVARLPRGRGFLPGWTMGVGMATSFETDVYESAEEAARRAHSYAERAAEEEQEYQAEQRREEEEAESARRSRSGSTSFLSAS